MLRFDFTGLGQSAGEFAESNFSSNINDLVYTRLSDCDLDAKPGARNVDGVRPLTRMQRDGVAAGGIEHVHIHRAAVLVENRAHRRAHASQIDHVIVPESLRVTVSQR